MELNAVQSANRVQWVRDLLSGKYKQGRHSLRSISFGEMFYCCLGVLCEKAAPNALELKIQLNSRSPGYMNKDTLSIIGISPGDQTTAAMWNDSDDFTFERIADLVAWATRLNIEFIDVNTDQHSTER